MVIHFLLLLLSVVFKSGMRANVSDFRGSHVRFIGYIILYLSVCFLLHPKCSPV